MRRRLGCILAFARLPVEVDHRKLSAAKIRMDLRLNGIAVPNDVVDAAAAWSANRIALKQVSTLPPHAIALWREARGDLVPGASHGQAAPPGSDEPADATTTAKGRVTTSEKRF